MGHAVVSLGCDAVRIFAAGDRGSSPG